MRAGFDKRARRRPVKSGFYPLTAPGTGLDKSALVNVL